MTYITVRLTEDQAKQVIEALDKWAKFVTFDRRKLTEEEKAHNAFIERTIKLFKAG